MPTLLIAVMLSSSAAAPAPNSAANPYKHDPNRVICKQITRTGSRASVERICATRREWQAAENRSRNFIATMQRGGGVAMSWAGQ
jgi:hypothetical protein